MTRKASQVFSYFSNNCCQNMYTILFFWILNIFFRCERQCYFCNAVVYINLVATFPVRGCLKCNRILRINMRQNCWKENRNILIFRKYTDIIFPPMSIYIAIFEITKRMKTIFKLNYSFLVIFLHLVKKGLSINTF